MIQRAFVLDEILFFISHLAARRWAAALAGASDRGADVAVARADAQLRILHRHADAVELPVGGLRRGVAQHVLLVQLVGDARGGILQALCVVHDFRPPAALAGDLGQRGRVHLSIDRVSLW